MAVDQVNVRDFGAVGDAVTDDTAAIRKALAASPMVFFPAGVYVVTDGIRLPEGAQIKGIGSPKLGTFPMIEDDKRFLGEGKKAQLPGTTLLFKGSGALSVTINRQDEFSTFRPAIATAAQFPFLIEGMAIALDVNVVDGSGRPTAPADDQRADYDVGLFVDDAGLGTVRDVCVYGFYKKAGLLIDTRGVGGNPDYNTFWNCSFMGNVGVALLGDDQPGDKLTYGLSGTQFYGCNFYAMDHQDRKSGEFGQTAILIDGHTNAKDADLNGTYFFGGSVRTYSPNAVTLKAASNVAFFGTIFELPKSKWGGADYGANDNRITGTDDTRDVAFYSCRMQAKGLNELGRSMKHGKLLVSQGHSGDLAVHSNGVVARLYASEEGRAVLQLSDENESAFSGWNLDFDAGNREQLDVNFDGESVARFEASGKLVVNSIEGATPAGPSVANLGPTQICELSLGAITVNSAVVEVRNAAEQTVLRTIAGGSENQLLVLMKGGDTTGFRISMEGNLNLSADFTMRRPTDRLTLLKSGEGWSEISRIGGDE